MSVHVEWSGLEVSRLANTGKPISGGRIVAHDGRSAFDCAFAPVKVDTVVQFVEVSTPGWYMRGYTVRREANPAGLVGSEGFRDGGFVRRAAMAVQVGVGQYLVVHLTRGGDDE